MIKKSIFCFVFMFIRLQWNYAQNPYKADSFTYSINLDLSQNIYLKTIPASILEGYCRGDWNGYYPKKEMNQCLFDDFLSRFNYFQLNVPVNSEFCTDDYCTDSYFKDMYNRFTRKLKYREIIYYDMQHSVVKREVLWFQLYYSREESDGWKHYNGPIFWMQEINKSTHPIIVYNKSIRGDGWSLEKEFQYPGFIVNENNQIDNFKKIEKYEKSEEN